MCGIAGLVDLSMSRNTLAAGLAAQARAMADALVHRGPDDEGVWCDAQAGIAFGFRRLAIVDLSSAGHQPMESPGGRYVIVFNGEIYNHQELRRELLAADPALGLRGHADTEVLLAAIEAWGLAAAMERACGMFALALWDRKEQTLRLARDRLGEKPLHYGIHGRWLLFGSELKALSAHPAFDGTIDREALALYMRHGYVSSPRSIYRQVAKLPPGALLEIPLAALRRSPTALPRPVAYWSAKVVAERGAAERLTNYAEAKERVEQAIRASIAGQMVADVPVGAFLSGGINSSLVVALMQQQTSRKVKTFSIGFHEPAYNEAGYAKAVAAHLGTNHTEFYVTPEEAQAVIPKLSAIYDEPFADSSQIPTYVVSQLARQQVTVSLSGDGGDELFAGYTRYHVTRRIWTLLRQMPTATRRPLAQAVRSIANLAGSLGLSGRLRGKLDRVAELLPNPTIESLYRTLVSYGGPATRLVMDATAARSVLDDPATWARLSDPLDSMLYLDLMTYLPDDILVKVDRAAMAVGLETRMPFLDHRLVDLAGRLPIDFKIRAGSSKFILRDILAKYVPPALTERPKMGFGVPIGRWLRGPLRDWVEWLLDEKRLAADGLLDVAAVRNMWHEHDNLNRQWQHQLWAILMFQAWHIDSQHSAAKRAQAA